MQSLIKRNWTGCPKELGRAYWGNIGWLLQDRGLFAHRLKQ